MSFHDENTPNMTFDEDPNRYHCFGCNKDDDFLDPINPELQKIYVISLKRFRGGIYDLHSKQILNNKTGEIAFFDPAEKGMPNNYAVHGDTRYL